MDDNRETPELINRREALRAVTALLGGSLLVGSGRIMAALDKLPPGAPSAGAFTAGQVALLDEIAETILPRTRTPGAKDAQVGAFMALMVTDCYSPSEQRVFMDGLARVDHAARKAHGVVFMAAAPAQRLALLEALDREQQSFMGAREADDRRRHGLGPDREADRHRPAHYFRMMKELALLGYFTSKVGYTQVLRYSEVPGRYDPCLPYVKGEPAWGDHA